MPQKQFLKTKNLQKERELLDRELTFFHFGRAIRKITKCIKWARAEGSDFFFYYFSAQAHIINEDFKQAIYCLNKAISLRPEDGCSYNDKALCLAELKKYQEAIQCFNKGICSEPDCASLYQNKGWLLHLQGQYKEALICFHKAFEIDNNRIEALFSIADTHAQLGNFGQAKHYFQKVLPLLKNTCSYIYKETRRRIKSL